MNYAKRKRNHFNIVSFCITMLTPFIIFIKFYTRYMHSIDEIFSFPNSKSKRLKTSQQLKGIFVALCCHHQCYWPHYVGRPFLQKLGFTPSDFHIVCNMSSWATCGIRPTKEDQTSGREIYQLAEAFFLRLKIDQIG